MRLTKQQETGAIYFLDNKNEVQGKNIQHNDEVLIYKGNYINNIEVGKWYDLFLPNKYSYYL